MDALSAMQILRQHGDEPENHYDPSHGGTGNVCMHSTGPTNPSQTTGSMVFELPLDGSTPTIWLTGTSMPCLSVYLPCFFGGKTLLTPEKTRHLLCRRKSKFSSHHYRIFILAPVVVFVGRQVWRWCKNNLCPSVTPFSW